MSTARRRAKAFKLLSVGEILERPDGALYDFNSKYRIDSHTFDAPGLATWDHGAKKQVGRRAIEVALMRCEDAAEELRLPIHREDWKRVEAAAAAAHRALTALGTALSGEAGHATPQGLFAPFRQMAVHVTKPADSSTRARQDWANIRPLWATQKAMQFCEAEQMVAEIQRYLSTRAQETKHDKKPGELAKNAFVFTMAELWVLISGKRPGSGPVRNPFLRLVAAAWEDAGGSPNESFERSLRQTLERMEREPVQSPPHWL